MKRGLMHKLLLLALVFGLSACATSHVTPPRSPVSVRTVQTRNFSTLDQALVMRGVLNVLQDEGFIARSAETTLGLITATKETDRGYGMGAFITSVLSRNEAAWPKTDVIEATANVSPFGRETRLRLSFHRRVLDNRGNLMGSEEVTDPVFYQEFFRKIDQGLFLENQRI